MINDRNPAHIPIKQAQDACFYCFSFTGIFFQWSSQTLRIADLSALYSTGPELFESGNWQMAPPGIYCIDAVSLGGVIMKSLFCIPNFVLWIIGALFGASSALVWNAGFIQNVRGTIPYVLVLAVILFAITAVLKARCGNTAEVVLTSTCSSLRKYSPSVIITAAIVIVFAIFVIATVLTLPTLKLVLAFVGAISFWTMLLEFIAMVSCMLYRR
jgi:hypothetical protein